MLTEEVHAASVAKGKVLQHEDAAHEKRNWVRLNYECNNKCIFCLDSDTHNGEMRDPEKVKQQILDGRRKGATRLILSGGEPTIHPRFIDFVRLGRMAGYSKVQTVTNGRLFGYQEFIDRCLAAGLSEITFSLHGPNARVHDALVGVPGAFVQESAGLRKALGDGRPIVNVDIVINRGNVKVLPEMLETFYGWGVREFDLLQVVPFGRAFSDGRDILFYDLEEAAPYIQEALEFSKRPDVHVWFNRFPPPHLEGHEHLIQDPYKLNDEVRGRRQEFTRQLEQGEPLDCRAPERCKYCYLEKLCDGLEAAQRTVHEHRFTRVRIETEWEAGLPPAFGGDPASARRAQGKRSLRVIGAGGVTVDKKSLVERVAAGAATRFLVVAPNLARAQSALRPYGDVAEIELQLDDYSGLELDHDRVVRATASSVHQIERLLEIDAGFEVTVELNRATAPWLRSHLDAPEGPSGRITIRQPTYERLSEATALDIDAPAFFRARAHRVPVEGLPRCVIGEAPRDPAATLDTAMMRPDGQLEIFRYAKRYILDGFRSKSLRCRACVHDAVCEGLHINQVRAHGYGWLRPITEARAQRP